MRVSFATWRRVAGAVLGVVTLGLLASGGTSPAVKAVAPVDDGVVAATIKDQTELAVTVYNSNIALVRDVRQVVLPNGILDLRFLDIAATVNPATVHFRSLSEPARLGILEQNYQFDLLDPQRLLKKYIGRDVTLVRTRMDNGTSRQEEVTARLLAFNEAPVWKIGDEIVTGMHAEQYRFAEIPENLHSRPTLVWKVDNSGQRQHRIETSYLATNMSWMADYVLTVARDDVRADLDGWVTVNNTSGTSYKNAKLQLVAGDLHRVAQGQALRRDGDGQGRARGGGRAAGLQSRGVLRVPPLRAEPEDDAARERDQADLAARGHGRAGEEAVRRQRPELLLPQSSGAGLPAEGPGASVLQVPQQRGGGARHADAGRHRARVSGGLEGRDPVCGRRPHRPHAEGRGPDAADRHRV